MLSILYCNNPFLQLYTLTGTFYKWRSIACTPGLTALFSNFSSVRDSTARGNHMRLQAIIIMQNTASVPKKLFTQKLSAQK